jgi:putative phage-type endonuclease
MIEQGSSEWLAQRAGHATASRFKDVLAKIKTGEAATRRNYRVQLVTERLTGQPCETYTNAAMQWGTDQEPAARSAYEAHTGDLVEQAVFILHPGMAWAGASPDGLIGDDGGIEIKCPYQSTVHVETLQGGMPSEHMPQVQGVMWITGRQWVDFVSYDPRMPEHLQLYVQRIARDEKYIAELEKAVVAFLGEVSVMHQQLMKKAA